MEYYKGGTVFYARMEDINITSSCREGHKVNFVAVIACKTSNKCQGQQTTTESTTAVQQPSFILLNNCEMGWKFAWVQHISS